MNEEQEVKEAAELVEDVSTKVLLYVVSQRLKRCREPYIRGLSVDLVKVAYGAERYGIVDERQTKE